MVYKVTMSMSLLFVVCFAQVGQQGPPGLTNGQATPTISVETAVTDIKDGPEELSAKIKFSWTTTNADYVLLSGVPGIHPPSGFFLIGGGGSLVFTAVHEDKMQSMRVSCVPTHRFGPGKNGLIWSASSRTRASAIFDKDWHVVAKSSRSVRDADEKLEQYLQGIRHFSVKSDEDIDPKGDSIIFSHNFARDQGVVNADEARKPPNERKYEYQYRIDVWLEHTDPKEWTLHVKPLVLRRSKLETENWSEDPNSLTTGESVCQEILRDMKAKLE
jgi:hypothetical protein